MEIRFSSTPTPGSVNEDLTLAGGSWAVILDGATARPGVDTGCIHSVSWLVHHLGGHLSKLLETDNRPLAELLETAISLLRLDHGDSCDLSNRDSPSSTVVIARWETNELEYLVLADSPLVLDVDGHITPVVDDRTAHLVDYSAQGVARARNAPDGFWVASTMPSAAHHAITGSYPAASIRRAALLSDGAARLVERFKSMSWSELLDFIADRGPQALIDQTRRAERSETAEEAVGRRGKGHDDASVIYIVRATATHDTRHTETTDSTGAGASR
ncbi:protein phosphatase 2C domain-containing protein [Candidatus Frankia nodulisporulans]|uniref:protein phosphatase 2C domain-containing protein n=1 Tax=Candidatus Frankia nodulisporulans TaxID=2060052 RepID=UPI0013D18EFD|nr:protein phosphatase 2C domain-containing protein [Candidatus Frankia nodulisporulans]